MMERITRIDFKNYKALPEFSLRLSDVNLLVGPNNCGKSTIVGALRLLERGIRQARSRSAGRISGPGGYALGHSLKVETLPISIENVHTDYSSKDSLVTFHISNGNELVLYIPMSGGCFLIPRTGSLPIRTAAAFKKQFPITLSVVPVLGPVEQEEPLLQEQTVPNSVGTHRASRHFRNYWRLNSDGFDAFAKMVETTWPGMKISPPEFIAGPPPRIAMFCTEDGMTRELSWSGSGFQVWCQLLTHLSRAQTVSYVVVDEPEIYLHPDVQRQLLDIVRDLGPNIVIATHSTEMIADAAPSEIVLVDKTKRKGKRLRATEDVQGAIESIGSVHNLTLTALARTRKVLFVEGVADFKRLRRFAKQIGLEQLASGSGLTAVESGGFASWRQIRDFAGMLEKTLGTTLSLAAVYDRDYWSKEEITQISQDLNAMVTYAHIHDRKELENYLLLPDPLARAVEKHCEKAIDVRSILEELTAPCKSMLLGQYIAKKNDYLKQHGRDHATSGAEVIDWFQSTWDSLDSRMMIVSGKQTLAGFRARLQAEQGVSLSDARIIGAFHPSDLPQDLTHCLKRLNEFISGSV